MAIPKHDLAKVQYWPEVKAAIEARDAAAEAARVAYRAWKAADRVVEDRNAELDEVAGRALEAWRQEP